MLKTKEVVKDMDQEWILLILEAKKIGITIEEVRNFLHENGTNKLLGKNT